MIQNEEILIFIHQLGLLFDEYKRCKDTVIQEKIYDDILLLSDVIKS